VKTSFILAAAVAIVAIGGAFYYVSNLPPPDTYTVVQVCKARLLHLSRGDAIVRRDRDQKLFVRTARGYEPADENADYKDLCP